MKDDAIYIDHILQCIEDIECYVSEGKHHFLSDKKTYDATLRKLQIMSESTQKLSASFKESKKTIDWIAIAGFRNVLVHDYLGDLDGERVWQIIAHRLPELKTVLTKE